MNDFGLYLDALRRPFRKLSKLEFLQPDDSVAFSIDNNYKRGYRGHNTRAFLQSGSLNVSLQNGQRRHASVTLANRDGAFDYAVNRIWFGSRIRLSMGLVLPNGQEFYLPQGVFYVQDPSAVFAPSSREITYNLVDKWSYLDGSLFGYLDSTYCINKSTDGVKTNIFDAMRSLLRLSRFDYSDNETDVTRMIDLVEPIFTNYYNGRVYALDGGGTAAMTDVPYDMAVSYDGGTIADLILELNEVVAGIIGYDPCGALRVEPSQDDINDSDKPILWHFTTREGQLLGITDTAKNTEVYNDVIIIGEGLEDGNVYGRATNLDPTSDTNVNLIGRKTWRSAKANYWNAVQCADLAEWHLKRKTVMQKAVSLECSQMFHLMENRLISVERTDKAGSPTERHVIQSFTLPIGETGSMSVSAVSVSDYPVITTVSSY